MTEWRNRMGWRRHNARIAGVVIFAVVVAVAGVGVWNAEKGVAQTPSLLPKLEQMSSKLDKHLEQLTRRLAGIEGTLSDLRRDPTKIRDRWNAKLEAQRQTLEQKFADHTQAAQQQYASEQKLEALKQCLKQKIDALKQSLQKTLESRTQALQQSVESSLKTLGGKVDSLRSWHENGTLQISGTPAGATVKINGEVKGVLPDAGQPPLQVAVARYYRHKVLVEKDRFFAEEKSVRLLEPTGDLPFALASAYTSLRLTSEPSGALVSVNGRKMGSTPITTDVQKGSTLALRFQRANLPALDETLVLPKDAASETKHRCVLIRPGSRQPVASLPQGHARYLPPGSFVMGQESGGENNERPTHTATFTKGAWMLETEVTQAQYKAIVGVLPETLRFKDCGDTCPVERVSWHQAAFFANELSKKENLATCFKCEGSGEGVSCTAEDHTKYTSCKGWRLPTEAEWEYAARAGTTGDTYGKLDDIAWYSGNSHPKTYHVRQKQANLWGLYDMLGNVWEWCYDWKGDYTEEAQVDPAGPSSGWGRVFRGGSWGRNSSDTRAAYRFNLEPSARYNDLGVRLLRSE